MSQAVVDHLEAIQVQEEHCEVILLVTLGAPEGNLQPIHEQGAVAQTGELIVEGVVPKLFFGTLALDGIAYGAGEQVAIHAHLGQIVLSSLAHRPHRQRFVVRAGKHDDGRPPRLAENAGERVEADTVRQ